MLFRSGEGHTAAEGHTAGEIRGVRRESGRETRRAGEQKGGKQDVREREGERMRKDMGVTGDLWEKRMIV